MCITCCAAHVCVSNSLHLSLSFSNSPEEDVKQVVHLIIFSSINRICISFSSQGESIKMLEEKKIK